MEEDEVRVKKSDLLIGGQMCPPTSGRYYPLYSPVDGELVAATVRWAWNPFSNTKQCGFPEHSKQEI